MIWPAIYAQLSGSSPPVDMETDYFYDQVISLVQNFDDPYSPGNPYINETRNLDSWEMIGTTEYASGPVSGLDFGHLYLPDGGGGVRQSQDQSVGPDFWLFAQRDFTIEVQAQLEGSAANKTLYAFGNGIVFGTDEYGNLQLLKITNGDPSQIWSSTTAMTQDPVEYTLSRVGSDLYILVDGAYIDTFDLTGRLDLGEGDFFIGAREDLTEGFVGYLGRWRVTMDVGRYGPAGYMVNEIWPSAQFQYPVMFQPGGGGNSTEKDNWVSAYFTKPLEESIWVEVCFEVKPEDVENVLHFTPAGWSNEDGFGPNEYVAIEVPAGAASLSFNHRFHSNSQFSYRMVIRNVVGQTPYLSTVPTTFVCSIFAENEVDLVKGVAYYTAPHGTFQGTWDIEFQGWLKESVTIQGQIDILQGSFADVDGLILNGVLVEDVLAPFDVFLDKDTFAGYVHLRYWMSHGNEISYRINWTNKAGERVVLKTDPVDGENTSVMSINNTELDFVPSAITTVAYPDMPGGEIYIAYEPAIITESRINLRLEMLNGTDPAAFATLEVFLLGEWVDILSQVDSTIDIEAGSGTYGFPTRFTLIDSATPVSYKLVYENQPAWAPVILNGQQEAIIHYEPI